MFSFLPAPIIVIFVASLYALSTFLLPIPVLILGLFYYLIPIKWWRRCCDHWMQAIGKFWGSVSNSIISLFTKIEWQIRGAENLSLTKSYLVIANHQSWADILVIQKAFNDKTPFARYFIKQQLSYVPIIGWCWKLLHYPTMRRYKKEQLQKRPELKGKDIETTRRACAKFQEIPVTLINFTEGTRFTSVKHLKSQSPYQYLLAPRAGGVAFALAALGEYLDAILDVTIIYNKHAPSIIHIFTGKVSKVIVDIKRIPVTQELLGDYMNDPVFKQSFQSWINTLWHEKDKLFI